MSIFSDSDDPTPREQMNFMRDRAFSLDDDLVGIDNNVPHDSMLAFPDSHRRMITALRELRTRLDSFLQAHGS